MKALFRLYEGSIKALWRLYWGCMLAWRMEAELALQWTRPAAPEVSSRAAVHTFSPKSLKRGRCMPTTPLVTYTCVSIRQHTSAYVSICQHSPRRVWNAADVCRQHRSSPIHTRNCHTTVTVVYRWRMRRLTHNRMLTYAAVDTQLSHTHSNIINNI